MIKSSKVNGVNVAYVVADPGKDGITAVVGLGKTVKEIGQAAGATVSANFNYADTSTGTPIGRVIADGKTVISDIAKTAPRDELYMLPDESLHIGKAPAGATWALQGSPRLLRGGRNVIAESVRRDQTGNDIWTGTAYRLAAGLTADGRLVVVRTMDKVTLDALAAVMAALGCVDAINGDGGGSAYLWPSDNGWGRKMGAALIIKEGQTVSKLIGDQKPELVIDPGHGGADPGASGNGIVEKHMTLDISLYQFKRAKELGIPVALTRDSDITLDSNTRAALVKNSGAKYCLSNHINSAAATTAAGVETIHSIYSDGKLATAIAIAIMDAGQTFRRVFSRTNANGGDYYYMHRLTGTVSTVISEYGFCSNAADAARLKANWQAYAEAALRAYCQFTGRRYTPPKAPEQPKPTDDITGHWAEADIRAAQAKGLLNGFPDGTFRPDEPVTRAQLAAVLGRLK